MQHLSNMVLQPRYIPSTAESWPNVSIQSEEGRIRNRAFNLMAGDISMTLVQWVQDRNTMIFPFSVESVHALQRDAILSNAQHKESR